MGKKIHRDSAAALNCMLLLIKSPLSYCKFNLNYTNLVGSMQIFTFSIMDF